MGEGEAFYSLINGFQSFSESVPLMCEFHKCFSAPHPLLSGGTGWLSELELVFLFSHKEGQSWLELDISLPLGEVGSDKTPAG